MDNEKRDDFMRYFVMNYKKNVEFVFKLCCNRLECIAIIHLTKYVIRGYQEKILYSNRKKTVGDI